MLTIFHDDGFGSNYDRCLAMLMQWRNMLLIHHWRAQSILRHHYHQSNVLLISLLYSSNAFDIESNEKPIPFDSFRITQLFEWISPTRQVCVFGTTVASPYPSVSFKGDLFPLLK
jgi:hypothetical protein